MRRLAWNVLGLVVWCAVSAFDGAVQRRKPPRPHRDGWLDFP